MDDLGKTLSLFEGSDLIFLSHGEERGGEYVPHSVCVRLFPEKELLQSTIEKTPLLPNDFGIMPFKWKAKSEEDKSYMIVQRRLSRWSEGELLYHGYLIIDRILLDIDLGELSEQSALKLAEKLRARGIGKIGCTGGGLLAVLELDGTIEVRDRKTFQRIKEELDTAIRKVVKEYDPSSLNAGKGVRIIGTHSRKRDTMTKWLFWEEGKKFDICELTLGIPRKVLAKAPEYIKERLRERFGIEVGRASVKASPEEIFRKAGEFYGELDGKRNEFMLGLSGEMLSAGVNKDEVINLYYDYLADLEVKDKPHTRIQQTIEYVYREGKKYKLRDEYPEDFMALIRSMRGQEVSLSWKEFAKEIDPVSFAHLLKLIGEKVYEDARGLFHLPSGFLYSTLSCRYVTKDKEGRRRERKGEVKVGVVLDYTPCFKKSLEEYSAIENGETRWYLHNLLYASLLFTSSNWKVTSTDVYIKEFLDNPYTEAVILMTLEKGLGRDDIKLAPMKRKIGSSDSGWTLTKCNNPLLKRNCSEVCPYYKFRDQLPQVERKKVDKRTGKVISVQMKVEGESFEAEGIVLASFRAFSRYLEKRGFFLSQLEREWLYQEAVRYSPTEYVDYERERHINEIKEVLESQGDMYIENVKDGYIWVKGRDFLTLVRDIGISVWTRNLGEFRERLGLKVRRVAEGRYTLIPLDLFPQDSVELMLSHVTDRIEAQIKLLDIETEVKNSLAKEDLEEEDYVLGRKAFIVINPEGVYVQYMGHKLEIENDPFKVMPWIQEIRESEPSPFT